jgi:hypothetical protein
VPFVIENNFPFVVLALIEISPSTEFKELVFELTSINPPVVKELPVKVKAVVVLIVPQDQAWVYAELSSEPFAVAAKIAFILTVSCPAYASEAPICEILTYVPLSCSTTNVFAVEVKSLETLSFIDWVVEAV